MVKRTFEDIWRLTAEDVRAMNEARRRALSGLLDETRDATRRQCADTVAPRWREVPTTR